MTARLDALILLNLLTRDYLTSVQSLVSAVESDVGSLFSSERHSEAEIRSALHDLHKADVISIKEMDDLIDDYAVFSEGDRDEHIIVSDSLVCLGENYPVFFYENSSLIKELCEVGGIALNEQMAGYLDNLTIPASDRLVSLHDNYEKIEAVVASVERAAEIIRQSNTINPDRRNAWQDQLEAGLGLLKSNKKVVAFATLSVLLLQPLQAAYYEVAEAAFKTVFEAAIAAVRGLIGF